MSALSPTHYRTDRFTCECIDVTRYLPFLHGNAFKYVWRHADKHRPHEDLGKALVYLRWAVEDGAHVSLSGTARARAQRAVDEHVAPHLSGLPPVYGTLPMIVRGDLTDAIERIERVRAELPVDPDLAIMPASEAAYITGLLRRAADEPIPVALRDAIDDVADTWPARARFSDRIDQ